MPPGDLLKLLKLILDGLVIGAHPHVDRHFLQAVLPPPLVRGHRLTDRCAVNEWRVMEDDVASGAASEVAALYLARLSCEAPFGVGMIEDTGTATVIARESRAQVSWRLLGSVLFVALGVWASLAIPRQRVVLICAAAFFAVLTLRYAWSLARPGYLRISPAGLEQDLGWRRKVWAWDQIEAVLYKARIGPATAVLIRQRGRSLPVRLFGWTQSPADLKRIIDGYRPPVR